MPIEREDDKNQSRSVLSKGTVISHYRIIEKIGSGGMGFVFKAEDTKLDRIVALKFLPKHLLCDEEAKIRFVHEAKAASALNHPNITTIHEIDEIEGECFICMEYIEGKSLKELIKEREIEGWDMGRITDVGIQIAEGLSKAHQKGIVHRDIKSDNIMLTNEGLVKIMDFGLAKLKGVTKVTKTGTTLGTVAYMSPEQAQGAEVDQRSDIFSFGVVLYEMITGQLPFQGEHEAAIIYSIINETPEPLGRYKANVPEGLQRIVDKALKKDLSTRYQSASEVIADLKELQKETLTAVVAKPKKKLLPFLVPTSIVFIVVLLLLILKPFEVEIVPEKTAIAKENSLAIMYFENMVDREDTERLGEIVTNLLITDLSESEYMRVVSSQRLYDILKLLGREGEKKIDREVASQVATKAGARWMLLGNILQVEPRTVITTQLVNVESGHVEASQHITGEMKEEIFSLVDKLTVEVKNDLSLPAAAEVEQDRPVADVTTHSPEAYRYYLEGLGWHNKLYLKEAETCFEKAIGADSTFAMAYFWLAQAGAFEREANEAMAKAVKYSDRVSHREKHYIRAMNAARVWDVGTAVEELQKIVEQYPDEKETHYLLGNFMLSFGKYEDAARHLTRVIEVDPLHKIAYNDLAYIYHDIGDFEKSIWAINKYISLAPDEANPYDSRGELYAYNGRVDQAIESFKKALEIKPDFYASLTNLGRMYLFKRDYAKAESCFRDLSSCDEKDIRVAGRTFLALIPLYQGKLDAALGLLDDAVAADRMERAEAQASQPKHLLKAFIHNEKGNLDAALKEIEISADAWRETAPWNQLGLLACSVYFLAEYGEIARAEEVALALKEDFEQKGQATMFIYLSSLGTIELAKGNPKAAVSHLERAKEEMTTYKLGVPLFLSKAYLESGRLDKAVSELENVVTRYDDERAFYAIWAVKAHYLLGLAYERSGWTDKAIEQYEEFLDIWKDADPGIPEVEDAKGRLRKLRIGS